MNDSPQLVSLTNHNNVIVCLSGLCVCVIQNDLLAFTQSGRLKFRLQVEIDRGNSFVLRLQIFFGPLPSIYNSSMIYDRLKIAGCG